MAFESEEVGGNGTEKNFVLCPFCGQKMLSVAYLVGKVEFVVKCRRCHKYIKIRLSP